MNISYALLQKLSDIPRLHYREEYIYFPQQMQRPSLTAVTLNKSNDCIYSKDVESQSFEFVNANKFLKKSKGFDRSNCPKEAWLNSMSTIRSLKKKLVLVNVGFNKGYNFAIWMNRFIASDVNTTVWFQHVWKGSMRYRGLCNEYADSFPRVTNDDSLLSSDITMIGIDMNVNNIKVLVQSLPGWLDNKLRRRDKLDLYLFTAAGGASLGYASVPQCNAGSEFCRLDGKSAGMRAIGKIPILPIDSIIDALILSRRGDIVGDNIAVVDVLMIDTEGHDPDVLDGAWKHIQSRSIRCVIFEYHSVGVWQHRKLSDIVHSFYLVNYECYFEGQARLWPISAGCWHSRYEFRKWANVMCIKRDDIWFNAIQSYVVKSISQSSM